MAIKKAVFDWNGTVYAPENEGPLWKNVGISALKDSLGRDFNPKRFVELSVAFLALSKLSAAYKKGGVEYGEIYDLYNDNVLSGLPLQRVNEYIARFARLPKTQAQLDERILRPLKRKHDMQTAILSTGCRDSIHEVMYVRAAADDTWRYFDEVIANGIVPLWTGSTFDYRKIYTGDDKAREVQKLLPPDVSHFLYMGDSNTDIPVMQVVDERGGYVAPSFHATEQFKEKVAGFYNGRVFGSEEDFRHFLQAA